MTRAGYRLTSEAEEDRYQFVAEYGYDGDCSCHLSPPCSSCIHPGNPHNQVEDDAAWEPDPDELLPSLPQLPEQAGVIELPPIDWPRLRADFDGIPMRFAGSALALCVPFTRAGSSKDATEWMYSSPENLAAVKAKARDLVTAWSTGTFHPYRIDMQIK